MSYCSVGWHQQACNAPSSALPLTWVSNLPSEPPSRAGPNPCWHGVDRRLNGADFQQDCTSVPAFDLVPGPWLQDAPVPSHETELAPDGSGSSPMLVNVNVTGHDGMQVCVQVRISDGAQ